MAIVKTKKSATAAKAPKPIGAVTHYYGGVGVAIVKFNRAVKVGETVHFKGANTDFTQPISSMQFDHKDIQSAKKGQEVGIKVDDKVREGDNVYEAEK
ncbi:translation elongation factor-like protein [Candidatus Azambacteria bacterium]|nr:translation elongation factor-like protein [Candidatus Azambacteria bacterium]MBI3685040.1 translation elongation factor-like protein [Candidatus Azambacteria bacterium]